jgi:hypothetical protein
MWTGKVLKKEKMSKYPPRTGKSVNNILGIRTCECGHVNIHHVYGWFSSGCCLDCMCPKFKEIK